MPELVDCYQDELTQPISSWRRDAQLWNASDELAAATFQTPAHEPFGSPLRIKIAAHHRMPPEPIRETIRQASQLIQLPAGWNSYGAKPVPCEVVLRAITFLVDAASRIPNLAPPTAVPVVRGGLQFEWHRRGVDIEVEFRSSAASLYAEDRKSGEVTEVPLAGSEELIQEWLERASD